MSGAAVEAVIATLRERGVIATDSPSPDTTGEDRPWFIALLQGVAGWLAGIFILAFLGMLIEPKQTTHILVMGSLLLGAAWLIYHADREGVFFDQFALAISIAGQLAVAWAIFDGVNSATASALGILALQIVVLVVMPNATARIIATLFATIAWVYAIRLLMQPSNEDFLSQMGLLAGAFGLGRLLFCWLITWAPLLVLAIWLIRREPRWVASGIRVFARPVLTGLLLGVAVGGVAAEPLHWLFFGIQGMGMEFSWLSLFPLLSMGLALMTSYGGFRLRSYGLLGFGIIVALVHLGRFYYMYGSTLLVKSVIMLCAGVFLLALGVWLKRREFKEVE